MTFYLSWSMAELKVECRRYRISTYGVKKKSDLAKVLLEAHVKRTRQTLNEMADAENRRFYPFMTLTELKAELRSRKLHVSGAKDALVSRLRDSDWKEYCDSRLKTFPQFSKLPLELQEYVWQYSLPGSRVLATSHRQSGGPCGLSFRKSDHTPNPAALSTCRLSRKIALQRFQLVFATTNIYADLNQDIFYVGANGSLYSFGSPYLWEYEGDEIDRAAAVIADLEKISYLMLAYPYGFYRRQLRGPQGMQDVDSPVLKADLSRFKGLKELYLSCGGSDNGGNSGQIYIEHDILKFSPIVAGDHWSFVPKEAMVAIKTHFYENPTEEDIARGIPKVQLVEVHRIEDAPRRLLQDPSEQDQELYYDRPEEHWKG